MDWHLRSEEAKNWGGLSHGSELCCTAPQTFSSSRPLGSQSGQVTPRRRHLLPRGRVSLLYLHECARSHASSFEWASPGKMERRKPQLELLEARPGTEEDRGSGCCVGWGARLSPAPATAQAWAEPGGVQRQQTHSGEARLWPTLIQALPPFMPGTGLVLAQLWLIHQSLGFLRARWAPGNGRSAARSLPGLYQPPPLPCPVPEVSNMGKALPNTPAAADNSSSVILS